MQFEFVLIKEYVVFLMTIGEKQMIYLQFYDFKKITLIHKHNWRKHSLINNEFKKITLIHKRNYSIRQKSTIRRGTHGKKLLLHKDNLLISPLDFCSIMHRKHMFIHFFLFWPRFKAHRLPAWAAVGGLLHPFSPEQWWLTLEEQKSIN